MSDWFKVFKYNPIDPLLESNNDAIKYFTRRDLLDEKVDSIEKIWELPEVQKILKKQQKNGSWKSNNPNQKKYPLVNYNLIETWKQFRFLVQMYQMNKTHPSIKKAAEYIFSCQKDEGDIRGILANQYATYYTGALMFLLIKAGYSDDLRIEKGFQWLISVRQNDGGWLASPLMSVDRYHISDYYIFVSEHKTLKDHDPTSPSSHNWIGMIIRPFAVHPKYKDSIIAKKSAKLLKSMFFKADPNYTSYQKADYWIRFQYPYWWNHLVAALDSISLIGISKDDKDIANALKWFITNQKEDGLWLLNYAKKQPKSYSLKAKQEQLWITFKICQIFKRYFK
ncbi:MAG: hypothetical protein JXA99_05270 [Candidatus Lokiarchaeota archaeon]|nr:hypothetical protein [Candidatus Lokiarchaeota archaeon]